MAGEPRSIKKLRSGDLLVEYSNKKQIENLLRLKSFHNLNLVSWLVVLGLTAL